MDQKIGAKKLVPLALSLTGIILWIVALAVREDFVDFINAAMFVLALALPVITLILSKGSRSVKARRCVAVASLIAATVQVVLAAVYYYVYVVLGGGPGLEVVPGATLFISFIGMIHGYLINLMYVLAAAAFIASSAACWFVLRVHKAPEDPQA